MEYFSDLQKSSQLDDNMIYYFLTNLLDRLYGQHEQIIIPSGEESEESQQLIRDQWIFIDVYFKVPKRVKTTERCVRNTLKYIVDYLNKTYQFKHPITFNPVRNNVRKGDKIISICYTEMFFK